MKNVITRAAGRFINNIDASESFLLTLLPDDCINYLFRHRLVNSLGVGELSDGCFDRTLSSYRDGVENDNEQQYCDNAVPFHSRLGELIEACR